MSQYKRDNKILYFQAAFPCSLASRLKQKETEFRQNIVEIRKDIIISKDQDEKIEIIRYGSEILLNF